MMLFTCTKTYKHDKEKPFFHIELFVYILNHVLWGVVSLKASDWFKFVMWELKLSNHIIYYKIKRKLCNTNRTENYK
jgi:hypothetical protein